MYLPIGSVRTAHLYGRPLASAYCIFCFHAYSLAVGIGTTHRAGQGGDSGICTRPTGSSGRASAHLPICTFVYSCIN